jgi:hypothetical protein
MSEASNLYEADGVAWAEQQAAALRARGAGRNQLDYENLAEEIDDVGRNITRACESYIAVILEHLLKLQFAPSAYDENGWRRSIRAARFSLRRELTPTLRARLPGELAGLFEEQVALLVEDGTLRDAQAVQAALPEGYAWDAVVFTEWYPERQASLASAAEQGQSEDQRQA